MRGWCKPRRELRGPPESLTVRCAPVIFPLALHGTCRATLLGIGVMATRLTLDQVIGVRLPDPQLNPVRIPRAGFFLPAPRVVTIRIRCRPEKTPAGINAPTPHESSAPARSSPHTHRVPRICEYHVKRHAGKVAFPFARSQSGVYPFLMTRHQPHSSNGRLQALLELFILFSRVMLNKQTSGRE